MREINIHKGTRELTLEEQKQLLAGDAQVEMNPVYLTKTACEAKALQLIASGEVSGMTFLQIAQEIFAHACVYYATSLVTALGIDNATINDLKGRANPVNITDGGDTTERQLIYTAIWVAMPSVVSPI